MGYQGHAGNKKGQIIGSAIRMEGTTRNQFYGTTSNCRIILKGEANMHSLLAFMNLPPTFLPVSLVQFYKVMFLIWQGMNAWLWKMGDEFAELELRLQMHHSCKTKVILKSRSNLEASCTGLTIYHLFYVHPIKRVTNFMRKKPVWLTVDITNDEETML